MHPNPRKAAPVILLLGVILAGWWYFSQDPAAAQTGALSASGTIEATQVVIAPELGGQVAEVSAQEGDQVKAGQVLVRFQDHLLKAQYAQAQAALAQAQANYNLVAAGPAAEQRQAAVAAAEQELTTAQQALQALNDTAPLAAAHAQQAVANADKALDLARQRLDNMKADAKQVDVDAAEAEVVLARNKLDKARDDFKPYEKKDEDNIIRARLQARLAAAQKAYDALVERLNNLLGTSNAYEFAVTEANLAAAEAQLADATRLRDKLQDGIDPDTLAIAQARVATAEAHLAAAMADPTPEQLALAKTQVEAAQAGLDVLQTQLDKLSISSPVDALVLSRSVEPGEVSLPGAPLLTLARLDNLTITIYIPEDQYGAVQIGQEAQVKVDSFPGVAFTAQVTYIAGQAEFTPRNVQTAEGRRTTVFAVKLRVADPQGRLKPGMPADVSFGK